MIENKQRDFCLICIYVLFDLCCFCDLIVLFSYFNVCVIGVLFGYLITMLKLTPGETTVFCGMRVKKWMQPLLQLILLSFLINASFIGHLSGIVCGAIYITGFPGFFQQRQKIIKYLESLPCLTFLTKRSNDFIIASQQPCFDHFNFAFFSFVKMYLQFINIHF